MSQPLEEIIDRLNKLQTQIPRAHNTLSNIKLYLDSDISGVNIIEIEQQLSMLKATRVSLERKSHNQNEAANPTSNQTVTPNQTSINKDIEDINNFINSVEDYIKKKKEGPNLLEQYLKALIENVKISRRIEDTQKEEKLEGLQTQLKELQANKPTNENDQQQDETTQQENIPEVKVTVPLSDSSKENNSTKKTDKNTNSNQSLSSESPNDTSSTNKTHAEVDDINPGIIFHMNAYDIPINNCGEINENQAETAKIDTNIDNNQSHSPENLKNDSLESMFESSTNIEKSLANPVTTDEEINQQDYQHASSTIQSTQQESKRSMSNESPPSALPENDPSAYQLLEMAFAFTIDNKGSNLLIPFLAVTSICKSITESVTSNIKKSAVAAFSFFSNRLKSITREPQNTDDQQPEKPINTCYY